MSILYSISQLFAHDHARYIKGSIFVTLLLYLVVLGLMHHNFFRKLLSGDSKPRSWFGPNGQYIRELPCPSCRGRGYTPCTECGIERSRADCSLCSGKVIVSEHLRNTLD